MRGVLLWALPFVVWLAFVAGALAISAHEPAQEDAIASVPIGWRCQRANGCIAWLPRDGKLVGFRFARGTRIEETGGWIIDPEQGWKKVD